MKKVLLSLTVAAVLGACTTPNAPQYTINGSFKGLENGKEIYLAEVDRAANKLAHLDTTTVEEGKFVFTGKVDQAEKYYIVLSEENNKIINLLVNNADIAVSGHLDSLKAITVTGGANDTNIALEAFIKPEMDQLTEITNLLKKARKEDPETFQANLPKYNEAQTVLFERAVDFIKENPKADAIPFIYNQYVLNGFRDDVAKWEEVLATIDSSLYDTKILQQAQERIALVKSLAIGQVAPEFTQNDKDGNPITLSSFRGKPLLIDFWASWCGPCRRANPGVVKTYNKYKEQGFQILGVSLDKSKEKWLEAVEKDGLEWAHVSDLQYWSNAVAKQYGVQAVPFTLLLDAEGKIVGKNLHGEELEKKIEELLPNS